jgi:hypothetical protein
MWVGWRMGWVVEEYDGEIWAGELGRIGEVLSVLRMKLNAKFR